MSEKTDKTEERIRRIYEQSKERRNSDSVTITEVKIDKENIADPSIHERNQKMFNFINESSRIRSEINKTDDPMKALDLSLQCVSIYLDDNGFFYRNNKSRLIGG